MRRSLVTAALTVACGLLCAAPALALPTRPNSARPIKNQFRIASVHVTTDWNYNYSAGSTDDGSYFSTSGDESTSLTLLKDDPGLDKLDIFTALVQGSYYGSFFYTSSGQNDACPNYSFNPVAIGTQLQLSTVALSHHRVELNADVSPGQLPAQSTELQNETLNVGNVCGDLPGNVGYGLQYGPTPNNVHTSQCAGIVDGCEIFPAAAFNRRQVTVRISGSAPVAQGYTLMPDGASGHDTFTWSITAVLKRVGPARHR